MKCSLGISNFLEESFPFYCFPLFLCIDHWRRLSCLSLLFFETVHSSGYVFPFLLCLSFLFFSQLFVRPPQTTILPFCISFSWGWSWSLFPVQCHEPPSIVHFSHSLLFITRCVTITPLKFFCTCKIKIAIAADFYSSFTNQFHCHFFLHTTQANVSIHACFHNSFYTLSYNSLFSLSPPLYSELLELKGYFVFLCIPVIIGESSGTPLQYSCLENPMDGGAW